MIKRYTRAEMERIWTVENRYECWLEVELAACRAMHELGIIPAEDLQQILDKADFDGDRIEFGQETAAAERSAASAQSADNFGLVARPDLAQLNTGTEKAG